MVMSCLVIHELNGTVIAETKSLSMVNFMYGKIGKAYQNIERQGMAEISDPHQVILVMLQELLKSMQLFIDYSDSKMPNPQLRSKHFARALTIIYTLQTSLDFEKGGEIAQGLFQLYEYARQQLIHDLRCNDVEQTRLARQFLVDICDAWGQIGPDSQ